MPYELRLAPPEARLVALAIAYHLGRPGSEIDPATLQVRRLGLAMPAAILKAQQGLPEAKLTLELDQLMRLKNAMLQTISELKVISMSEAPWTPGPGSGRVPDGSRGTHLRTNHRRLADAARSPGGRDPQRSGSATLVDATRTGASGRPPGGALSAMVANLGTRIDLRSD